ncbi:MAG: histidine--tRNA ligase [Euryarchaeota archaeon]|nr:histidine--tRNA ligase [Euryarchaeota archaeon]
MEKERSERFARPKGTRDFWPHEMERRRRAESTLRDLFHLYGYREVATPTFENLDLFTRKSGEGVKNQLYAFKDKSDRDITLRPELTAPVLRFYVNELSREPKPLKLYYFGNCFRYEEPQSGRYREFWQFGLELIGPRGPEADGEVIAIAAKAVESLGLSDAELRIGHIGILRELIGALPIDEAKKAEAHRKIDKKEAGLAWFLEDAGASSAEAGLLEEVAGTTGGPDVLKTAADLLSGRPNAHKAVQELTRLAEIVALHGVKRFHIDLGVVRGLDYYTGAVFEIHSPSLGAESQVCGGGAYSLAEMFGGESVGSSGFGLGFDRVLLASAPKTEVKKGRIDAFIVPVGPEARGKAIEVAVGLRAAGISADSDLMDRSISKCLDYANAIGARRVVIIGKKELESGSVTVKNMETGAQESVRLGDVAKHLKAA